MQRIIFTGIRRQRLCESRSRRPRQAIEPKLEQEFKLFKDSFIMGMLLKVRMSTMVGIEVEQAKLVVIVVGIAIVEFGTTVVLGDKVVYYPIGLVFIVITRWAIVIMDRGDFARKLIKLVTRR